MELERATTDRTGVPEFTELGKRIEMLRIERGISKQHLAKYAGTSRQQLWRVMTGKCELSGSLKHRLLDALQADSISPSRVSAPFTPIASRPTPISSFPEYAASPDNIIRTLSTLPTGARGRALKRRLLDAIEDVALDAGVPLGAEFFDLRRRVVTGDL
jgi:transcriptional regulator with XRE-family HTH domain